MRCLDDDLHAMTDLVDYLAANGASLGANAEYLGAQLPALEDCSSGAQQMLAPVPPGGVGKVIAEWIVNGEPAAANDHVLVLRV